MPSLFESQREMARCLVGGRGLHVKPASFTGAPSRIEQGLGIYRANLNAAAGKALAGAYPVVLKIVGAEFFDALAREYRKAHPSKSGDLNEFGAEFEAFLVDFAHVQDLAYLPDLARLEWRVHQAEGAADSCDWDVGMLRAVEEQQMDAIRFAWRGGTAVVDSPFPIVRVWALHQPGYQGEFAVDWTLSEHALVARDGFVVRVEALDTGTAAFFSTALRGAALGAAAMTAVAADPAFDLAGVLARAIAMNLICGLTLEGSPS